MRSAWIAVAIAAAAGVTAGLVGRTEDAMAGTKLIEAGAEAPDFRLNDHEGRGVRLSDFRGKAWVALAFFPKAMTGG